MWVIQAGQVVHVGRPRTLLGDAVAAVCCCRLYIDGIVLTTYLQTSCMLVVRTGHGSVVVKFGHCRTVALLYLCAVLHWPLTSRGDAPPAPLDHANAHIPAPATPNWPVTCGQ